MALRGTAQVIAFINLKGGVGKTTCAVNVASTLAAQQSIMVRGKQKRPNVLFIDTDPQSNASLTFLPEDDYVDLDADGEENKTLFRVFEQLIRHERGDTTPEISELVKECQFGVQVSTKETAMGFSIDLIPSSLRLLDIQDELWSYRSIYRSTTSILCDVLNGLTRRRSEKGLPAYTHIIIDCPPSLGLITLNALSIADAVVVPVLLDAYSHWGLEKITERLTHIRCHDASCRVKIAGVLYSQYFDRASRMNEEYEMRFAHWIRRNLGSQSPAIRRDLLPAFARENELNLLFERRIARSEAVRKSEDAHRPVIGWKAQDANDRGQQVTCQRDWTETTLDLIERMRNLHRLDHLTIP